MIKRTTCMIVDDEPTAREILQEHISNIPQLQLIGSCSSAVEAFQLLNERAVDLIFLDINMPKINGISFAKSINKDIKVIFTTAYREYAVEGFDLQAVDYLVKPISFERLLKAVNLYDETYKYFNSKSSGEKDILNDHIFVKADRKMQRLDFSSILYIESFGDYLKIHLKDHIITIRETISNIESRLPKESFIRVHRSFIISMKHINSFTNEWVEVGGQTLTIGRSYKSTVLEKLGI